MEFKLAVIDWNTISAISTFIAVLVALFYQPFQNRRKVELVTSLITDSKTHEHEIRLTVTNLGAKPIWLIAFGVLYKKDGKTIFSLIGADLPAKLLAPSEPISFPNEPIIHHLQSIDTFYAKDSNGKFWYISSKNKKSFKKQREICLSNNKVSSKKEMNLVPKPKLKSS
jgi:hypothetical protein